MSTQPITSVHKEPATPYDEVVQYLREKCADLPPEPCHIPFVVLVTVPIFKKYLRITRHPKLYQDTPFGVVKRHWWKTEIDLGSKYGNDNLKFGIKLPLIGDFGFWLYKRK